MTVSAAPVPPEALEGRCYTAARRYPLQIGRFAGGGRIPGGPYTLTQLAVMIGGFVVLIVTRPVWGGHGPFDFLVAAAVPFAAGWAVHRVQIDHRNPLAALVSLSGLVAGRSTGRIHGRPCRAGAPRLVSPRITLHTAPVQAPTRSAAAGAPVRVAARGSARAEPAAAAGPAAAPMVSGVQALLARRTTMSEGGSR
ncbi:hypothetical protein SAMN05216223_116119 [Actinacidiphila yanglinensis]|uniref:Uncharacterized protein n=1 Tax=Actinacidiphila yanglinensis TaxID=310779 RepID=A0A1H6DK86_9ACTN|nr:hypothetical protein [Actinacidiphila yanglinensis]SEG85688.1 hypothetical protein SAMN05216223_116119 [Actinacidiphila yanglinensis]